MTDEAPPVPTPDEAILLRLAKLKLPLDHAIPYRLESVFAKTTGWWANSEIKRRAKMIRLVEPTLRKVLLPNEEVLYVACGVQYSFAESYFMGALLQTLLNQTVFVLTSLRLVMMQSNGRGKPRETFWVIYYSEIEHIKPTWTGVLKLKLRDRKNLQFTGFSRLDRKAMPALFQEAIDQYRALGFEPEVSQSRENLCSTCFHVVPKGEYICEQCGAEFWRPRDLALRSLIFPSWGDLCMKHYVVATVELLGYVMSWIAALAALNGPDIQEGLIIAALIFTIEHPMDALLTYYVAKKGLTLRKRPDSDFVDGGEQQEES